jgi:hypothetical protein
MGSPASNGSTPRVSEIVGRLCQAHVPGERNGYTMAERCSCPRGRFRAQDEKRKAIERERRANQDRALHAAGRGIYRELMDQCYGQGRFPADKEWISQP